MTTKEKQAIMFAKVDEWKRSGKTMREFATEIGLSKSCFEYWIRKKRDTASGSPQFIELVPSIGTKAEMHQSIEPNEHITQAQIVFTFPGGLRIKVYG